MSNAKVLDAVEGDKEYKKAFQLAKDSLERFESFWKDPYEGERNFMFKVRFQGERRPVYIWLDLEEIQENSYLGHAFEVPAELPQVREDVNYNVDKKDVYDWMVNDKGKVYGGFTLLVERRKMSKPQKEDFDYQLMAKEWIDENTHNKEVNLIKKLLRRLF